MRVCCRFPLLLLFLAPFLAEPANVGIPVPPCVLTREAECAESASCSGVWINDGVARRFDGNFTQPNGNPASVIWIKLPNTSFATMPYSSPTSAAKLHPPFKCPPTPFVFNCSEKRKTAPRSSYLWLPRASLDPHSSNSTRAYLSAARRMYTDFSFTWAYWNNPATSKCGDAPWGLCRVNMSDAQSEAVAAARALGYRITPIIEACCTCIVAQGNDWRSPMQALVADAAAHGFSGYMLDMVCGADRAALARTDVLTAFEKELDAHLSTRATREQSGISWWSHWKYDPWLSFPNGARYVFSMDTYRYPSAAMAAGWTEEYQCQAGIGLTWPGPGSDGELATFLRGLRENPTLRAVGSWGPIYTSGGNRSTTWEDGLAAFIAAP
eukprot:TRINITY_DN56335_c0_g1_i1.p1 TRINITY_DN56335_c0_g1~~TRINITY_DN56335_c0_g1_i1.p1  ORF type:complete len:382 (+),score=50.79 TRINITY_DN56335_c0_g1_i1:116-1261(+)